MSQSEIEQVLANWIAEASSSIGVLSPNEDPNKWIARHFLRWWREQTQSELGDLEEAISRITMELEGLGGWSNPQLGDAMHELIHARDALSSLSEIVA